MIINQVGGGASGENGDWFLCATIEQNFKYNPNVDILTVTSGASSTSKSIGRYSASSSGSATENSNAEKHYIISGKSYTAYAPSTSSSTPSYQYSGTIPLPTKEELIDYMPYVKVIYGEWRIKYTFVVYVSSAAPYYYQMGEMYVNIKPNREITVTYNITGNLTVSGYCTPSTLKGQVFYSFYGPVIECVSDYDEDYTINFVNSSSGGFYGWGSDQSYILYVNGEKLIAGTVSSSSTKKHTFPSSWFKDGDVLTTNSWSPSSITVDSSIKEYTFTKS